MVAVHDGQRDGVHAEQHVVDALQQLEAVVAGPLRLRAAAGREQQDRLSRLP